MTAAAYAARNAALSQQAATLKQQQATPAQQQQQVKAQMGELQASQISGDGVYVVGKDIKAGVYHTNGSGNTGANDCYLATLNSTGTSNIADNNKCCRAASGSRSLADSPGAPEPTASPAEH